MSHHSMPMRKHGHRVAGLILAALMLSGGCRDRDPLEPNNGVPAILRVQVNPGTVSLVPADTMSLTAHAYDSASNEVMGRLAVWTSADSAIARVSVTGLVTGMAVGTTTVTATVDGRVGTATIHVAPVPVDPSGPAIVSNPVALTAPVGTRLAALLAPVVYVSIRSGTFDDGIGVSIRNTRTGSVVTVRMIAGGFDPVAVDATVGDTLEFTITLIGGSPPIRFAKEVPVARPPVIVRTDPPPGKRDVPLNASIMVVFSEPVDSATVSTTSIKLTRLGVAVSGQVTLAADGLSATFQPDAPLLPTADYTLAVTTTVTDLDSNPLEAPATVAFTTGDVVAPVAELAFVRDGQIYQVNPDGTGLVRLSDGPGDANPAWSPDGRRIAFSRGGSDIYVMDADGSNVVQRTSGGLNDTPSWSPDGTLIVFAGLSPGSGSLDVYVMKSDDDGTSPINLINQQAADRYPAWSPDGTRIAFVSDWVAYDFTADVFIMTPTGSQRTRITDGFLFDGWPCYGIPPCDPIVEYYQPAWSPDGRQLALITCLSAVVTCDASTVSVMNADGSGLTTLTTTNGFGKPTWSPDGTLIAFSSFGDIHWIRADGSGRGVIIANGHSPAWRR